MKLNLIGVTVISSLLLTGCTQPAANPTQLTNLSKEDIKKQFCAKAKAGVEAVEQLAATTTTGVTPFPKIDILESDLRAVGTQLGSGFPDEYKILDEYKTVFSTCLTSPAVLLLDNSSRESFLRSWGQ